eukprot:EG_transcript_381
MNEKLRSLLQRSEADPGSDPASASPRAFADGERGRNMTPTRGMTPTRSMTPTRGTTPTRGGVTPPRGATPTRAGSAPTRKMTFNKGRPKRKHHAPLQLDVGPASSFKEVMVAGHFAIRSNAGLPALVWSPQLEVFARRLINHLAEKGKLDIVAIAESSVKAKALPWTSPEPLEPYAAASRCCEDLNFNAVTEAQDQYACLVSGATTQFGAALTTTAKGTFVVVAYSLPAGAVEAAKPTAPAKDPAVLFREVMLSYHNKLRAKVQVGPLVWDANLQRHAQAYAEILAKKGVQEHSAHDTRPDQGENLCFHPNLRMPADQIAFSTCQAFEEEAAYYSPGTLMEVYKAPIFGHYTQMVWQESSKLGAAMAVGERGIYVVCRYSPGGNRLGMAAYGRTPAERRARLKTASKAVQSETFKQVMLERHNRARARVGAPPLQWSTMLELQAEAWVCVMADKGTAMRSPPKSRRRQGETFFVTAVTGLPPEEAAKRCCDQYEDAGERYVPGTPYGNFDAGLSNYTQMVWSTTSIFAASVVQSPKGTFIVCRYYPAGNEPGKVPFDPDRVLRSPTSKHWQRIQHSVLFEHKPKSGAEQLRMVFELAMMEQAARQVACEPPEEGRPDPWQKLREKVMGKEQTAGAAQMRGVFEKALAQMTATQHHPEPAPVRAGPRVDNWRKLRENMDQRRSRSASPQALLLKKVVEQAVANKSHTRPQTPPRGGRTTPTPGHVTPPPGRTTPPPGRTTPPPGRTTPPPGRTTPPPPPLEVPTKSGRADQRWRKLREQVQGEVMSPKMRELRQVVDQAIEQHAQEQRQRQQTVFPVVAEHSQSSMVAEPEVDDDSPTLLTQAKKRSHSASHRDVRLRAAFEDVLEEELWQQQMAAAGPRLSMHERWRQLQTTVKKQDSLPPGKARELKVAYEQAMAEHAREQMADRPHTPCAAWARLKDAAEDRLVYQHPTAQGRDLQRVLEIGEATLRKQRLQQKRPPFAEGLTLDTATPRSPMASEGPDPLSPQPPITSWAAHPRANGTDLSPAARCRPTRTLPSPHSKPVSITPRKSDLMSPTTRTATPSSSSSRTALSPPSGNSTLSPTSAQPSQVTRPKSAPTPVQHLGPAAHVGYKSPRLTSAVARGNSSPQSHGSPLSRSSLQSNGSPQFLGSPTMREVTAKYTPESATSPPPHPSRVRSDGPPSKSTTPRSGARGPSPGPIGGLAKTLAARQPPSPSRSPRTWEDEDDEAPSVLISPPTVFNLSSERAPFRAQASDSRSAEEEPARSPTRTVVTPRQKRGEAMEDAPEVALLPLRRPPDSYDTTRQVTVRRAKSHTLELAPRVVKALAADREIAAERASPSHRLQMASRLLKSDAATTPRSAGGTVRRPLSDGVGSPRSKSHVLELASSVDPLSSRSRSQGVSRHESEETPRLSPSPRPLTLRHPEAPPYPPGGLIPLPELDPEMSPTRRSRSHGLESSTSGASAARSRPLMSAR